MICAFLFCAALLGGAAAAAPCNESCTRSTTEQLSACVRAHVVAPLLSLAANSAPLSLPLLSCNDTEALVNCTAPLRDAACVEAVTFGVVVPGDSCRLAPPVSPCAAATDCQLPIVLDAYADVCDRLGRKCLADERVDNATLTRTAGCACVELVRSCYSVLAATCSATSSAVFAKRARRPFGTVCAAVRGAEAAEETALTCAACAEISGSVRASQVRAAALLPLVIGVGLFARQA